MINLADNKFCMLDIEDEALELMITNDGTNVLEISKNKNVMLVFLRHFGCQFCRETIDELSTLRNEIETKKTEIIFVHMGDNATAQLYFERFKINNVRHISDPTCNFYAKFGLIKGSFTQLFGLQSWYRGFTLQAKYGAETNKSLGDSFQMPGVFMIQNGKIVESFIHKIVSDKPDYLKLVAYCDTQR